MDELFEYLRKILYEPEQASINIKNLTTEQQDLAQGLEYLASCMAELRIFVKGLSKGNLNAPLPASSNPLTTGVEFPVVSRKSFPFAALGVKAPVQKV